MASSLKCCRDGGRWVKSLLLDPCGAPSETDTTVGSGKRTVTMTTVVVWYKTAACVCVSLRLLSDPGLYLLIRRRLREIFSRLHSDLQPNTLHEMTTCLLPTSLFPNQYICLTKLPLLMLIIHRSLSYFTCYEPQLLPLSQFLQIISWCAGSPQALLRLISSPAAPSLFHPLPLLCHPSLYLCTFVLPLLRAYFFANLNFFTVATPSSSPLTLSLPCVFVSFASLLMRRFRFANLLLIPLISVFLSNLRAISPSLVW